MRKEMTEGARCNVDKKAKATGDEVAVVERTMIRKRSMPGDGEARKAGNMIALQLRLRVSRGGSASNLRPLGADMVKRRRGCDRSLPM